MEEVFAGWLRVVLRFSSRIGMRPREEIDAPVGNRQEAAVRIAGAILAVIGIVNFLAFGIHCTRIGGSAANGVVKDGVYRVSDHGKVREVSGNSSRLNLIHGRSVWITHPLAMIGVVMLGWKKTGGAPKS